MNNIIQYCKCGCGGIIQPQPWHNRKRHDYVRYHKGTKKGDAFEKLQKIIKHCKCGCGNIIPIKKWMHPNTIPDYIYGHSRRGNRYKSLFNKVFYCKCGCGSTITNIKIGRKIPNFIQGHQHIHRKRQTILRLENFRKEIGDVYCQCGCNKKIIITQKHFYEGLPRYILSHHPPNTWYVSELGHSVRSNLERDVALFLKRKNICYEYEKPYHIIYNNGKRHTYFSDFTLTDYSIVIEAKGFLREDSDEKLKYFINQYPQYKFIIICCSIKDKNQFGTEYKNIFSLEELQNSNGEIILIKGNLK